MLMICRVNIYLKFKLETNQEHSDLPPLGATVKSLNIGYILDHLRYYVRINGNENLGT
ncbi:MAG: hypothetical protein ACI8P9_000757 [Parasphingorhabdus sp.]|jgi:hypothetical protein